MPVTSGEVSSWLGRPNLTTTEIYTRGAPTKRLDSIDAIAPSSPPKGVCRPPDKPMALLKDVS
jgi:hypothetical protein